MAPGSLQLHHRTVRETGSQLSTSLRADGDYQPSLYFGTERGETDPGKAGSRLYEDRADGRKALDVSERRPLQAVWGHVGSAGAVSDHRLFAGIWPSWLQGAGPFLATGKRICRELDRGAILYMEMHGHPVYGSHHLLCYGYRFKDGKLMLRTADGWISHIHELPAGQELFSFCTVITRK